MQTHLTMETLTNFTYFTLGAFTLFVGIIASPYVYKMRMRIKRYFTRKPQQPKSDGSDYLMLMVRIKDLEEQVHNLAGTVASRDKHRKHNLRRDVREYLKELSETKQEIK